MRPIALQSMTWVTVVAAVISALWLAGVEAERGFDARAARAMVPSAALAWPSEPAVAGPQRRRDDAAVAAPAASR